MWAATLPANSSSSSPRLCWYRSRASCSLPASSYSQRDIILFHVVPWFPSIPPAPLPRKQTLAMAAEATSRAARRRGLSRAISDVRIKAHSEGSSLLFLFLFFHRKPTSVSLSR